MDVTNKEPSIGSVILEQFTDLGTGDISILSNNC